MNTKDPEEADRQTDDLPYVPVHLHKGRGAVSNLAHRFTGEQRSVFDDGWGPVDVGAGPDAADGEEVSAPATEIILEDCKSAISANDSLDIPFDYSVNPYRGCEHGCIYCFARPTHSYLGYSPGLDFETKIVAKRNIAEVLAREIAAPRYRPSVINIGSATDCYQPVERELKLTRSVIEVMGRASHPFSLITKSSGVERDLDQIGPLAERGLAAVYVTITTLSPALARKLEPRAAAPQRRLRVIRTLAEAGVPVGVSVAPQIPFINEDMEHVLAAARDAGATRAFYTVLRLPWELAPLFQQWLAAHFPDRAQRVMARVRDMRGGKDYDATWGQRMHGSGVWAQLLDQRFKRACARLGYEFERTPLDLSQFNPQTDSRQVSLF